jgi:hypothetical protein
MFEPAKAKNILTRQKKNQTERLQTKSFSTIFMVQ